MHINWSIALGKCSRICGQMICMRLAPVAVSGDWDG